MSIDPTLRQALIDSYAEALRAGNEARYVTRARDVNGAFDQFGSVADYLAQNLALLHEPVVDPPPPPPPPPPPSPGRFETIHYGPGAREYFFLRVAPGLPAGAPMLVLWHGGGWLQGDPTIIPAAYADLVAHYATDDDYKDDFAYLAKEDPDDPTAAPLLALAIHVQQVGAFFQNIGFALAMPAYDFGVTNALADAYAAYQYIHDHAASYGADPNRMYVAGHSAGGHLAVRVAQNPSLPAPRGVLGLAAAGLYIDQNTTFVVPQTKQIFDTAWGARASWAQYSPHTHLTDREQRPQNVWFMQGDLGNNSDGSINVDWVRNFATVAMRAGWQVNLKVKYGDHYSVADPSRDPDTAAAARAMLRAGG